MSKRSVRTPLRTKKCMSVTFLLIPAPSWAQEAQSETLWTPQNVPAWIVSWPNNPIKALLLENFTACITIVQWHCTRCVQAWCTKDINSGANLHHRCITDHFEDDGDIDMILKEKTIMLVILMSNFLLRVPSADGFECFGPRRFSASRLSHCIRTADHPVINWFSSINAKKIKNEIFTCAFFFFGKYLSYNLQCF